MAETHAFSARLQARDVAGARGGRLVIEGVTLNVGPGEAVILRGENGAGKTTLLRLFAGLAAPATGEISIDTDEGSAAPCDATVFAGHLDGAKGPLTVAENLAFWARLYGASPQGLNSAAARMGLAGLEERPASALSAGQRRRLGLARVLLSGRPIWLLDEPTASMDAGAASQVAAAIAEHRGAGGAVVIATHDPMPTPGAAAFRIGAA